MDRGWKRNKREKNKWLLLSNNYKLFIKKKIYFLLFSIIIIIIVRVNLLNKIREVTHINKKNKEKQICYYYYFVAIICFSEMCFT